MIEKLKVLGADNQSIWTKLNDEERDGFIQEFLNYAKDNLEEIERFVQEDEIDYMSISGIVHEILSDYSKDHNDFVKREIERIVNAALIGKIKPSKLESLENFWLENMYESNSEMFDEIISFIITAIQKADKEKLKLNLIEQLDEFIYADDDLERWEEKLKNEFQLESENVRNAVNDIFNYNNRKTSFSKIFGKDMFFGFITFILYAALFIYSISLYKLTFIGLKEVAIMALSGGVLGLIYNLLKGKPGKKAFRYFYESIFEWGIPIVGITLILNYYSNIGDEIKKEVKILKKIEYIEETKIAKLFINHNDMDKVVHVEFPNVEAYDESSEIYLHTKKGGLGLEIMTDSRPKQ